MLINSYYRQLSPTPKPACQKRETSARQDSHKNSISSYPRCNIAFGSNFNFWKNYSGQDLSGRDFSNQKLKGYNFSKANLSNAILSSTNLNNSDLRGANFSNANLCNAFLINTQIDEKTNFDGANLSKAYLRGINLSNRDFSGRNFTETNFDGSDLRGVNFSGANLRKASFLSYGGDAKFDEKTNFRGADLSEADFRNVNLSNWDFSGMTLVGTNFDSTDLRGANFSGANLKKARFLRIHIDTKFDEKTSFKGADLSKALLWDLENINGDFSGANLSNACLDWSKFDEKANFKDAIFSGAQLHYVNLKNRDFRNMQFVGAELTGANLSGVDFSGANLSNANLDNTNLSNIKLDKNTILTGATYSFITILPDGFDPIAHGMVYLNNTDLSAHLLSDRNLSGYNFSNFRIIGANFSKSNLRDANFRGANLNQSNASSADFTDADFSNACLRSTDLSNADLSGANLSNADLDNTNLSDIKFDQNTKFTNARYNNFTKFPPNFDPKAYGMIDVTLPPNFSSGFWTDKTPYEPTPEEIKADLRDKEIRKIVGKVEYSEDKEWEKKLIAAAFYMLKATDENRTPEEILQVSTFKDKSFEDVYEFWNLYFNLKDNPQMPPEIMIALNKAYDRHAEEQEAMKGAIIVEPKVSKTLEEQLKLVKPEHQEAAKRILSADEKDINYGYTVLGIKHGDDIKTARNRLMKIFHPDRASTPEAKEVYTKISAGINKAVDLLK